MGRTLFLDCDDCLYNNDWQTADALTARIDNYCTDVLGLPTGKAFELYQSHGTCLRGLIEENIPHDTEDYLKKVHDVPLDIHEDAHLRFILQNLDSINTKTFVFTASVSDHAERCLKRLNIYDVLVSPNFPIIDCRAVDFRTKHSSEAFQMAMGIANEDDPSNCILVDDSWSNIKAAKKYGMTTVLVGLKSRFGDDSVKDMLGTHADYVIADINELPKALPDLFAFLN